MGESDEAPPFRCSLQIDDSSAASTSGGRAENLPRKCRRDPLGTLVHQVCCPIRPSVDNFVDAMNRLDKCAPRHCRGAGGRTSERQRLSGVGWAKRPQEGTPLRR